MAERVVEMFHRLVLLAIAGSAAAIAAFEEGETRTAAGHAATCAAYYAPQD